MTSSDFERQARAYLASLPILEAVEDRGRAVLLMGRYSDGAPCFAEVPRPLWLTVGRYFLPDPVQPADLTIWQGPKDAPTGFYSFTVGTDTAEGAALLEKLTACAVGQGAA